MSGFYGHLDKKAFKVLTQQGYLPAWLPDETLELQDEAAIGQPQNISALLASNQLPPIKIVVEEEDLEHYFFRIIQSKNGQS